MRMSPGGSGLGTDAGFRAIFRTADFSQKYGFVRGVAPERSPPRMWLGRPRAGASGSPARGSARAQCLDTGRPVLCTSEGSSETELAPYARAVFARAWP